jgi:hypothetical protein
LLLVLTAGAFAETPKYFAFEIGAGGAYDINTAAISSAQQLGFTYSFDDTFAGGFNFITIGANSIDVLGLSVSPANNLSISMYMGQVATVLGFGTGIGYDFFTKSDTMFTSFGVYLDWYAGNGGNYDITTGGVFNLGLTTKVGL